VHLLVLREVPEYLGEFLSVRDEGIDLEDEVEVVPSLEDYLGVVLFLGQGEEASLEQEVEESSNTGLELLKNGLYLR
jgi:hypothetical protein